MERAEDFATMICCKAALYELGIPSALAVGAVKQELVIYERVEELFLIGGLCKFFSQEESKELS